MLRQIILLASAFLLGTGPASAFVVLETAFEVVTTVEGEAKSESTRTVQLREDSCWYWYLRGAQLSGTIEFVERLILPVPPASWGDETVPDPDAVSPMVLEEGGRIGVSHKRASISNGWFGHGWCFLPGDPTGPHRVEINIDGEMVQGFDFQVVEADRPVGQKGPPRRRSDRTGRGGV